MNILAIESSCDETAAAVVRDGRTVLSNCVASQIEMHTIYGGVVPEIASRKHVEAVSGLAREALERAGLSREEDVYKRQVLRSPVGEPEFSTQAVDNPVENVYNFP